MRFFDREHELEKLHKIYGLSQSVSQFTVVTGRRRIGKTALITNAFSDLPFLYFFVSRSSESELCKDFTEEIRDKMQIPMLGTANRFSDIFLYVMELAKQRPLTLVIDEFQDFSRVNNAIFSQMQKIWDLNKNQSRLNLVVCGSVYTMMNKLFRDGKEPLYGRQTDFLKMESFSPSVLKQILKEYNPHYAAEDLLALYALTGGVAKYVELMMERGAVTYEQMKRQMIEKDSYFIYEGKNMLIEEFGRDYGRYFDILKLIASGHNTRGDIEGILNAEISGYMTRLEFDYGLIEKMRPMFQVSENKNVRYAISDNFLRFWFRFIYKYNSIIEANANEKLEELVTRDYTTYSGHVLERYFKETLMESGRFTHIGSWWDRKGENEIDIIAADDLQQQVTFYEVKRQQKELDMSQLKAKVQYFLNATGRYTSYRVEYKGLTMDDM